MDRKQLVTELEALSNANGAPGFEDEVVSILREQLEGLGQLEEDSLRNLYVFPETDTADPGRPVVMLDAHTDEVAFMVQAILPNGMLSFLPLGGWIPANAAAQRVRIQTASGHYIPGLIASKPPHYMSEAERDAPLSFDSMVIDIGASSAEEVLEQFQVRLGAPIVPDVLFGEIATTPNYRSHSGLVLGKAFDNRIGCAALTATLRALQKHTGLGVSVVGAYAAQEEVGVRGAQLTVRRIKPDIAICFEGAPADDSFLLAGGAPPQTALGRGPMLRHLDVRMITHPRFQRFALDLAEREDIPVQEGVRKGGGTNGAAIHLSERGIPCIVIGIPVRYAHTHYGYASIDDLEHAVQLATQLILALNADTIAGF